jgi:hypothetical protein
MARPHASSLNRSSERWSSQLLERDQRARGRRRCRWASRRPAASVSTRGDQTPRRLGEVLIPSQDFKQMIDILAAVAGVHLDPKPR